MALSRADGKRMFMGIGVSRSDVCTWRMACYGRWSDFIVFILSCTWIAKRSELNNRTIKIM